MSKHGNADVLIRLLVSDDVSSDAEEDAMASDTVCVSEVVNDQLKAVNATTVQKLSDRDRVIGQVMFPSSHGICLHGLTGLAT